MLKKKQQEELTQKIICYGTLLLCFVYFLKFVRGLALRKPCCKHQARPCVAVPYPDCQPAVLAQEAGSELQASPRPRRHRRRRNRQRHVAEQWLPRDSVCDEHDYEDQYE